MVVELKMFVGFNSCSKDMVYSNQAALNMFLDAATLHGNIAGENITIVPTRWLLSAYHVKFIKRPVYGDFVTVRTWGRSIKGVLSTREFEILDEDGNIVCMATSNWAHVDVVKKSLSRATQELIDSYQCEEDRHNFDEMIIEKLLPPSDMVYVKSFVVDRDKLDSNLHVNNVKYLGIADDIVPEEVFNRKEPNEFYINYRKELLYGDKVDCYYYENESEYYVILKTGETVNSVMKFMK